MYRLTTLTCPVYGCEGKVEFILWFATFVLCEDHYHSCYCLIALQSVQTDDTGVENNIMSQSDLKFCLQPSASSFKEILCVIV